MPEENPSFMSGAPHGRGRIQAPDWWETLRRAELPDEPEAGPKPVPGEWMVEDLETPAHAGKSETRYRLQFSAAALVIVLALGMILFALLHQG